MHPSLYLGGKLAGQLLGATNSTGHNISHLFYISDSFTRLHFLVYTGAQVSVIPPSPTDCHNPHINLTLETVNGTPIQTFGTHSLTLNVGLRQTFRWVFVIADTATPILGADFLCHFQLLIDMTHHRLVDTTMSLVVKGIISPGESPSPLLLPWKPASPFAAVLAEFPGITNPCMGETSLKHDATHHIITTGPPVSDQTHWIALECLTIARKEFQHMLDLIRPSSINRSSPLHMVRKRVTVGTILSFKPYHCVR